MSDQLPGLVLPVVALADVVHHLHRPQALVRFLARLALPHSYAKGENVGRKGECSIWRGVDDLGGRVRDGAEADSVVWWMSVVDAQGGAKVAEFEVQVVVELQRISFRLRIKADLHTRKFAGWECGSAQVL